MCECRTLITVAWKIWCSGTSVVMQKFTYTENFKHDWCSTDTGREDFVPRCPLSVLYLLLGDHANLVWVCEGLQSWLQILPDILFAGRAQFTWDGIANTAN
jgi:hypothetical protein